MSYKKSRKRRVDMPNKYLGVCSYTKSYLALAHIQDTQEFFSLHLTNNSIYIQLITNNWVKIKSLSHF